MKRALLCSLLLGCTLFANDARYNRGEMLYFQKGCNTCHGSEAEGGGVYPKLANKKEKYLKERILNFKNNKQTTVSAEMMSQFVQTLSDKEIEELVYFLSHHRASEHEGVSDELLGGYGS